MLQAAETAIILAHVTGRVLVLPPKSTFYLLDKNKRREDNESTFSKFFDLLKMREGMEIISMEDFLATTARMGLLKQEYPKHIPVSNFAVNSARLWQYLEKASTVREWEPGKMFFGFDIQGGYNGTFVVDDPTQAAAAMPATFGSFNGTSTNDRYKAMVAHGRKMLPYGEALHKEKVLYFPGDYRHTHRILTHFYTYLYWHNPHLEHIYRRIVRDRLRYHDDIFCVAGNGRRADCELFGEERFTILC